MALKHFKFLKTAALGLALTVVPASAQLLPANAHVNLYFPQIVDGGSAAQQWQTSINFTNPTDFPANVFLRLYASAGGPLTLDFGNGPSDTRLVFIPPRGSQTIRTRLASAEIRSGWGFAGADVPVLATLTFTQLVDGVPTTSVSAPPTVPAHNYLYPANYFLSVAVANTFSDAPIKVNMFVMDANGEPVATDLLVLPASGHTAFTLWQRFPQLDRSFEGSLRLAPEGANNFNPFIAWGMGSDSSGVISGLPSGQFASPRGQWDEIWRAFNTLVPYAEAYIGPQPVNLTISSLPIVNASASNGSDVMVTLGLAELLADSPSELAFAVAHELGHIYQQRNGGRREFRPDNPESDADMWGVLLSLHAGYDPYAIAGTLAKFAMATDNASLSGKFFEDLAVFDAHKSFNTRIDDAFDSLLFMCAQPGLPELCSTVKNIFHPHLPSGAPLMQIVRESSERIRDRP